MKFTAKEIAAQLGGVIDGSPDAEIESLSKIETATKGSLTFLANPKYTPFIYETKASIAIVAKDFIAENSLNGLTLVKVEDPYSAFTKLLEVFSESDSSKSGVHATAIVESKIDESSYVGPYAIIEEDVTLGANVQINSHCFVGKNVIIGAHTVIQPGVRILTGTRIGKNCIIHSGTVIGSDGFGFAPAKDGTYKKIPQTGNVIIGNDVEIGANTTIDKATLGSTIIGDGVKLDNQVQIAHNVEIKAHTVIAAQSGVAGSSKVGKHCVIGGQVGIIGHLTIGNYVKIQGQSGVTKNIPDNTSIQGTPSFDYNSFNKSYVYFKKLPQIEKRLFELEKKREHDSKNHSAENGS